MVLHHDDQISQVTLVPSYSTDERKCPCGCHVVVQIAQIQMQIAAVQKAEAPVLAVPTPAEVSRLSIARS